MGVDRDGGVLGNVARSLGGAVLDAECAKTTEVDSLVTLQKTGLDRAHKTFYYGCNLFLLQPRRFRYFLDNISFRHNGLLLIYYVVDFLSSFGCANILLFWLI